MHSIGGPGGQGELRAGNVKVGYEVRASPNRAALAPFLFCRLPRDVNDIYCKSFAKNIFDIFYKTYIVFISTPFFLKHIPFAASLHARMPLPPLPKNYTSLFLPSHLGESWGMRAFRVHLTGSCAANNMPGETMHMRAHHISSCRLLSSFPPLVWRGTPPRTYHPAPC